MRLSDLSSVQRWLPTHLLCNDPIWQRETHAVTERDIVLFYARAGIARRKDAVEAIDALQAAVIAAAFNGELESPPAALVLHELPEDPFFSDELVDGLVRLRPARRQAALFALESTKSPLDTANLTWSDAVRLQQLPRVCVEILNVAAKTRHFKLPYVFWEWATPQIAAPLLELQWSVETVFDCTWPELVRRYRRMVSVNRRADSASFIDLCDRACG